MRLLPWRARLAAIGLAIASVTIIAIAVVRVPEGGCGRSLRWRFGSERLHAPSG